VVPVFAAALVPVLVWSDEVLGVVLVAARLWLDVAPLVPAFV
jgi:hypothetical protein